MQKLLFTLGGLAFCLIGLRAQQTTCPVFASVSATKTNVLYLGVDNPVRVDATGIPADSLEVTISEGSITKTGKGQYVAHVTSPGFTVITVATKDRKYKVNFDYRVKRIPDPTPTLGTRYNRSDTLSAEVFKTQSGLYMMLENFDFDARCITLGYTVKQITWADADGKKLVKEAKNVGGKFNPEASELIKSARPGDIFVFSEITGKCPGDDRERSFNSLIFFVEEKGK